MILDLQFIVRSSALLRFHKDLNNYNCCEVLRLAMNIIFLEKRFKNRCLVNLRFQCELL